MATIGIGKLPRDGNNKEIQAALEIRNRDGTATPLESPQTVGAAATSLVVPTGAVALWLYASDGALKFGDNAVLDGTANEGYSLLPQGNAITIPCADMGTVYLMRNAGNVITYFHFEMLS